MMSNTALFYCFFVIGLVGKIANASDNNYCQLSCGDEPHTVCDRKNEKCGADPKCGPDFREIKLDDNKRQAILDLHNELRNKVALGQEGRQPSATNMMALSYNKELEFIAQCWVNSCNGSPLRHDVCRKTSDFRYVGQNLGHQSSKDPDPEDQDIEKMIERYWQLVYNWFRVGVHNHNHNSSFYHGTDHYTQMVWANTTEIGCAVSYYTTLEDGEKLHHRLLACNYGPGGNDKDAAAYRVGPATSECPQGKMNTKYKGLCGIDRKLKDTAEFISVFEV